MDITYLILTYDKDNNIEALNKQIESLNEKIELIDSNIKFNMQIFLTVLTLVITLISILSFISIKSWIERKVNEYVAVTLEEIINKAPKYEVMSGDKRFSDNELKNGKYSFIIGSRDLNIKFDNNNNNNISIKPLSGEEKLKYNAEVIQLLKKER